MTEEAKPTEVQQRPTKAPVVFDAKGGGLIPTTFESAYRMAEIIAKSGMVPKDYRERTEAVFVAMQMGAEVGLKPMQSVQNIAVINGRPSLWGDAVWALVQTHPAVEDAFESFDHNRMVATCTIKRRDRSVATVVSFAKEDAITAGLWSKDGPWKTSPKRMLQMRARAFAARDAVPEALKGISIVEEIIDIPPEREVAGSTEFVEQPQRKSKMTEHDPLGQKPSSSQAGEAATPATGFPAGGEPERQDAIPKAATFVEGGPAFGADEPSRKVSAEEAAHPTEQAEIELDGEVIHDINDPPFPDDPDASPTDPAPPAEERAPEPPQGPPMQSSMKNIIRARLAGAALTETDLLAKFAPLDKLKASQFNAVTEWIKGKAR